MPEANQTTKQAPQPGQRSRILVGLISEGFLSRLSTGVIAFALPLYGHHLGLSLTEIGVLVSLDLGVAVALKPFSGWVADRVGYKRGASLALAFRSLMCLLLAVVGVPWHLYVLQSGRGAAKAVRDPSMNALIAERGGKKRLASTFAWYQTARGTAGSLGRAVAGVLLTVTASSFGWVFGAAAALSVLSLVSLSILIPKRPATREHAPSRSGSPSKKNPARSDPPWTSLLPFMGFGFLMTGTARMLRGLMPLLLVEYAGLNEAQAGLLYLVATVVALVMTPIFGWLYDHTSPKLVLMARSLANVISSILYLVWPTFTGFALAKVFDKSGTAAFRPAWATLMADVSASHRSKRAQRMGLMDTGENAGAFVGPILGGFVWNVWGVAALMGTRIVLALLSELYALFLFRAAKRPGASEGGRHPASARAGSPASAVRSARRIRDASAS